MCITTISGVLLNSLINPETARGKGLVDVNLSVAMSHGDRWAGESGKDVRIPKELCNTLHNEDGIVNYKAKVVTVALGDPHLEVWRAVMVMSRETLLKRDVLARSSTTMQEICRSTRSPTPIMECRASSTPL